MKYPMINRQARREVITPPLSGGVNLRDAITEIQDNQVTDMLNMWFKSGIFRTRPNLKTKKEFCNAKQIGAGETVNTKIWQDIIRVSQGGKSEMLTTAVVYIPIGESCDRYNNYIHFYWQNAESNTEIDMLQINETVGKINFFVVEKDNYIYCFISTRQIWKLDISAQDAVWKLVDVSEYYVPQVYIHCLSDNAESPTFTGTQLEGYSLISPYYKMIYSWVGKNGGDTQKLQYKLGQTIPSDFRGNIKVTYMTAAGAEYIHTVEYTGTTSYEAFPEGETPVDGLYMTVTCDYVILSASANSTTPATRSAGDYVEDNLEIISACPLTQAQQDKVFKMTQQIWFGGSSYGIFGGSRLFLTGSVLDSEKALIVWSGLNEPLYFGENLYSYVGNKAHKITGFGRQSEYLVIFKEKETYYSYYAANTGIDADDIISQSIVDYNANAVYFPVIALSNVIGCDLPGTIQLCRNRLVWATTEGKVYTLTNNSQYSERNIYEVSEMAERAIKAGNLSGAVAVDLDGYYLLFADKKAFLMNYNSYGYQYVSGYSKTEDANLKIPWYIWDFPVSIDSAAVLGDTAIIRIADNKTDKCAAITYILAADDFNDADNIITDYTPGSAVIGIKDISSYFCTRVFDFNEPNYCKNVDRISVTLGNNANKEITATVITDAGNEQQAINLISDNIDARSAGYLTVKYIRPCIRSVTRLGLKLSAAGVLAVDRIALSYRTLGGAK